MRKLTACIAILILLCGCSGKDTDFSSALMLREAMLRGEKCKFQCTINADYESYCYTFLLDCVADKNGRVEFSVLEPEPISGISGYISAEKGAITFDDQVLAFPLLIDGAITPVSAPWIFITALRSGYIYSAGSKGDRSLVSIEDEFFDQHLRVEIEIAKNNLPERAVIYWQGNAFLSLKITHFHIL